MRYLTLAASLCLVIASSSVGMAESKKILPGMLKAIAEVPPELTGKWVVLEIRDQGARNTVYVKKKEPRMTISFGNGQFGLSAGCNGIQGKIFARDGQHHVVGRMISTMIACPKAEDRQERRLWQAFPERGHYHRVDNHLHLFEEDGQLVLTLVPTK